METPRHGIDLASAGRRGKPHVALIHQWLPAPQNEKVGGTSWEIIQQRATQNLSDRFGRPTQQTLRAFPNRYRRLHGNNQRKAILNIGTASRCEFDSRNAAALRRESDLLPRQILLPRSSVLAAERSRADHALGGTAGGPVQTFGNPSGTGGDSSRDRGVFHRAGHRDRVAGVSDRGV